MVVEDIVNVRSGLSNGCLCLVKMELGARRGRRVMKVRMGEESENVLKNGIVVIVECSICICSDGDGIASRRS